MSDHDEGIPQESLPTRRYTIEESLPARIAAIEARQREYGMHDPDCPDRARQRQEQKYPDYHAAGTPVCDCWLSRAE